MLSLPVPAAWRPSWRLDRLRISTLGLWLGSFFLIGLALRLVWVFYTDPIPLGGDPSWYVRVATNLVNGEGFVANHNEFWEPRTPAQVTAFWPPGYPFALAGLWKLGGVSVASAQVMNAVLGALTIPLVYGLGRSIFDHRVGLLGAGLFAVFPNAIAWTPLLFPEQLFVLLFVAALWVLVAFPPTAQGRWWLPIVAFGVLTGLATLTRGQGAVLVPVAVVYWLMRSGWRPTVTSTAVALLAAAAVISPWTVRNWVQMDAFIPISTNSGAALRVGHHADSTGTTGWTDDDLGGGFAMDESLYRPDWEVQGYREYTRLAVEYAVTHPVHEIELSGRKIYELYRSDSGVVPWLTTLGATPIEPQAVEDGLVRLFDYSYLLLLAAAAATVPLWVRRDAKTLLLLNLVLMWTLFHVVFLAEPRYHVPLYPVLTLSAAAGALALWSRWRARRGPGAAVEA